MQEGAVLDVLAVQPLGQHLDIDRTAEMKGSIRAK